MALMLPSGNDETEVAADLDRQVHDELSVVRSYGKGVPGERPRRRSGYVRYGGGVLRAGAGAEKAMREAGRLSLHRRRLRSGERLGAHRAAEMRADGGDGVEGLALAEDEESLIGKELEPVGKIQRRPELDRGRRVIGDVGNQRAERGRPLGGEPGDARAQSGLHQEFASVAFFGHTLVLKSRRRPRDRQSAR